MITNPDGTQSEVFTKEELEAAKKEATETATKAATDAATKAAEEKIEEFKKQNAPAAEEIETLKKGIEEKDAKIKELEGEKDPTDQKEKDAKDEQIKRLREEREEDKKVFDDKFKAMEDTLKSVVGDAKTELIDAAVKNAKQSDIDAAGGKEQYQKKLEAAYDDFKGDAVTRTQIADRVTKSVTLVTGNKPAPNLMDGATDGGARGEGDPGSGQQKEMSAEAKGLASKFGISEEDQKKYGPGGEKHHQSSTAA